MRSVRIAADVVYREIAGEIVALSLASGEFARFDAIGGRIWQLIAQHGSLARVKADLLKEYDLDEDTCDAELDTFVGVLFEGALVVDEGVPAGASRR